MKIRDATSVLLLGLAAGCTPPNRPEGAAPPVAALAPDSLLLTTAGVVGAGQPLPLLARTKGRVRKLYFAGGEYVHRGDVLAKLYNHNFVLAPRDGFLGSRRIEPGQYLDVATPVSTLSSRRLLTVALPPGLRARLHPGDSVRVWVAARPADVVAGVVPEAADTLENQLLVLLASGAPFRMGERACVAQWRRPLPTAAGPRASR